MLRFERSTPFPAALAVCAWMFGALEAASAHAIEIIGEEAGSDVFRALALAHGSHRDGRPILVPPAIGGGVAIAQIMAERGTLARVDRPLLEHERAAGLAAMPVFRLPIRVLAHPSTGQRSLQMSEIQLIRQGKLRNWRLLGGPDLPVRVLVWPEGDALAASAHSGFASLAELEHVLARSPGALAFVAGAGPVGHSAQLLPVEGRMPAEAGYPLMVTLHLVYRPNEVSGAIRDFLAFLRTEPARQIMRGQGAEPVSP